MKDSHWASSKAASSGTQPLETQKEEMPTSQSVFPDVPEPSSDTFAAGLRDVFMQGTVPLSYSMGQPVLTRFSHSQVTFRDHSPKNGGNCSSASRIVLQILSHSMQRQVGLFPAVFCDKRVAWTWSPGKSPWLQIPGESRYFCSSELCLYLFAGPCSSPCHFLQANLGDCSLWPW